MKQFSFLFLSLLLTAASVKAAPGDTTWVQANNVQLNNYNNFDMQVQFPNGTTTYRKVYMVFTLGAYNCPAGSQYCHQWDYTVQNYVMTPAGDTVELSRFITPYGNTGVPRFPTGWTYRYIFDVTDYSTVLKNTATTRIHYSGYSGGFTADVKFAFVEGVPERNVIGVAKLWDGSYNYGSASDPIDNHISAKTKTAPAGTQAAELKVNITGHGSDATGQCCEFDQHSYHVKLNGNTVDNKLIWRDDCGSNELYPQGGTWIYDRANWCPGALVAVNAHKLTGVTAGSNYTVDMDFDAYTNTPTSGNGGYGSYTIQGNVIYYGALNRSLNASIEDIIAPSTFEGHFRENPSGSRPVIKLRNTGATAVTSIALKYGVKDSALASYIWTGNLPSMKDTIITLPALQSLTLLSQSGVNGQFGFVAEITGVNGVADNDRTDDTLRSSFVVAPTWPTTLYITLKTNSEGVNGINQGVSETSWKITDMNDNLVAQRVNAAVNTTYEDTVSIRNSGFYKLTIQDLGCDGLHWWVWDQTPQAGVTAGSFRVSDEFGVLQFMNGFTYGTSGYGNDFGCGFTQYFTVMGWPTSVNHASITSVVLNAYPNPAATSLSVSISGTRNINGTLKLFNMLGQQVANQEYTTGIVNMDVHTLADGTYQLIYDNGAGSHVTKRINITH